MIAAHACEIEKNICPNSENIIGIITIVCETILEHLIVLNKFGIRTVMRFAIREVKTSAYGWSEELANIHAAIHTYCVKKVFEWRMIGDVVTNYKVGSGMNASKPSLACVTLKGQC